jgi:hypothetical protein
LEKSGEYTDCSFDTSRDVLGNGTSQFGFVAQSETITLEVESTLEQEIWKGQLTDEKIKEYGKLIDSGKVPDFKRDDQGTIWFRNRICVPEIDHLRETI